MNKIIVDPFRNVHSHLREPKMARELANELVEGFCDTILPMPNLTKPLKTAIDVEKYIEPLRKDFPKVNFIPTAMLTEDTTVDVVNDWHAAGISDCKVYPYLRTTKSENGVVRYARILPAVRRCGELGVRVHMHPEHPEGLFDSRDAEYVFLPVVMMLLEESAATIIWEHGTDGRCVPFWRKMAKETGRFYLTLTPHHLITNEDIEFGRVASICKPPIKTGRDRMELVRLVSEGRYWVMAGADDAPHDHEAKHKPGQACACGAYHAPHEHSFYAHALQDMLATKDGIHRYNLFMSQNAQELYQLPDPSYRVELDRSQIEIPIHHNIDGLKVESFWGGQTLDFKAKQFIA